MRQLSLVEVADFSGGSINTSFEELRVKSVSTDSRNVREDALFIALRGENFNGHEFVRSAAEAGAVAVMVEDGVGIDLPQGCAVVTVGDSLEGLQSLARRYRESLNLTVVGVTGSNGKTSTKDFIASVLSEDFSVSATLGNLNNHIGLPLTILNTDDEHEFGVWEMGMSAPGEIALLTNIAGPNIGVITNVGLAHIESMGSRESIALEKGTLAEYIDEAGLVILNSDDPYSLSIAERTAARTVTVGCGDADIRAERLAHVELGVKFSVVANGLSEEVSLPVPGRHMVVNALMATAVGLHTGLTMETIVRGLGKTKMTSGRLQRRDFGGVIVLDDSYNANPDSMLAALDSLADLNCDGRRFAVVGGMDELGKISAREHRKLGEVAANAGIDFIISVGEIAEPVNEGIKEGSIIHAEHFSDHAGCAEFINREARPGDLILFKGSRSSAMEKVIESLEIS